MNEYLYAGYNAETLVTIDGEVSRTIETLEFDIRNDSNISYSFVHKEYENESIKVNRFINIVTSENKYIYTSELESKEISKKEVTEIVKEFFYKSDEYDFHNYACYYGDIVTDSAYTFQDYTVIDLEKNLYIVDYNFKDKRNNAIYKQNIVVNSLGMLVSNVFSITHGENSSMETLTVYKK